MASFSFFSLDHQSVHIHLALMCSGHCEPIYVGELLAFQCLACLAAFWNNVSNPYEKIYSLLVVFLSSIFWLDSICYSLSSYLLSLLLSLLIITSLLLLEAGPLRISLVCFNSFIMAQLGISWENELMIYRYTWKRMDWWWSLYMVEHTTLLTVQRRPKKVSRERKGAIFWYKEHCGPFICC